MQTKIDLRRTMQGESERKGKFGNSKPTIVYTPQGACERMHLSITTVYMLLRTRQLGHRKVGRKYLITERSINRFFDEEENNDE